MLGIDVCDDRARCRRPRVKVPSLSSASTTIQSPAPSRVLVPYALMMPPLITVGSSCAVSSNAPIIDVVVVLPCRYRRSPATIEDHIDSPSISARRTTGNRRARAATISGLSAWTAEEITTTSAARKFPASWPTATGSRDRSGGGHWRRRRGRSLARDSRDCAIPQQSRSSRCRRSPTKCSGPILSGNALMPRTPATRCAVPEPMPRMRGGGPHRAGRMPPHAAPSGPKPGHRLTIFRDWRRGSARNSD